MKVFTIICRALRRRVVVAVDDRASHWSASFSREEEEANIDRKYLYVRRGRFDLFLPSLPFPTPTSEKDLYLLCIFR